MRLQFIFALLILGAAPAVRAEPWLCTQPDGSRWFSYEPASARNPRCVDHPIPSGNVVRVPRKDDPYAALPPIERKAQRRRNGGADREPDWN